MIDPRTVPSSFDLYGPLPVGTTVLEASAGTGKTYTIAALATRYIADGIADLSQLMMVTFGRTATNELRLRVRERLAHSERQLALAEDQRDPSEADELDRLLSSGTAAQVAGRRQRLRAALADFDAATIATTHEFCQTMLAGLGVLGDHDPDATFAESLSDLTREVAADCYLQRFATLDVAPPFDFDQAVKMAEQIVGNSATRLVPELASIGDRSDRSIRAGSSAALRIGFGTDVRAEHERRKRSLRRYSYQDMLTGLRDCLADPDSGDRAAERLRSRYKIVLVDEFQDTDPVQWDILRRAFHGHTTLILIGDPKQAIYAFRGADVYSYLAAVTDADAVASLSINWRSDANLVRAQQALMGGAALGDPRIVVRPVGSAHPEPRLRFPASVESSLHAPEASMLAPVRIRVREYDPGQRPPPVAGWRPELARDLARDVAALLASGAEIRPDPQTASWRPVSPGDIAVLVRSRARLEPIKNALDDVGVPAVVRGASSVFSSEIAQQWRRLLLACEQPRQALIREVALTSFVGWDVARLVAADDSALTELSARVRRWAKTLNTQGVAALLATITEETGLARRLLGTDDGERRLTDLRHVGETLHGAQLAGQLGIGGLLAWLGERIAEAQGNRADELSRRLETDAEAVQVMTIHLSKGLEFPIVYLPEAWDRWVPDDDGQVLRLHAGPDEFRADTTTGTITGIGSVGEGVGGSGSVLGRHDLEEVLDIGGALAPGRRERFSRTGEEEAGEDLRILYVALTRASSQVVTWWLPSRNTTASALQRFLFRARIEDSTPQPSYPLVGDPGGLPQLDPRLFSIETMAARPLRRWQRPGSEAGELAVRDFNRRIDLDWRRTSYSSLTAAAHGLSVGAGVAGGESNAGAEPGVGSEPEFGREDDEAAADTVLNDRPSSAQPGRPDSPFAAPMSSPMGELPMGTEFGTVVHALLETIDPGAEDLVGALTQLAATELARGPNGPMSAQKLAAGLAPALQTPLGPLAGHRRLCDIPASDRLSELTFELPLAGGDEPNTDVRLGEVAPLLRRHLGATDPLADYPSRLALPLLADQPLRGYLNGSIDAVLRIRHDSEDSAGGTTHRYLVVDYKTNWLGDPDLGPLPVTNYTPDLMALAMMSAHYPLQALLYSVALHRYLRWRQPGYEPQTHLGGVLYLFLRGMAGPETPTVDGLPCGVFSWRPPAALITDLSDLLDGRR